MTEAPVDPVQPAPTRRKVLTPRFTPPTETSSPPAEVAVDDSKSALDMLHEAIARRSCVVTTYNKRRVTLAPHIVYTKHDEPFLRAVTVDQDGSPPRELKLGTFKLTGLGPIVHTTKPFVRFPDYKGDEAGSAGTILSALPST